MSLLDMVDQAIRRQLPGRGRWLSFSDQAVLRLHILTTAAVNEQMTNRWPENQVDRELRTELAQELKRRKIT